MEANKCALSTQLAVWCPVSSIDRPCNLQRTFVPRVTSVAQSSWQFANDYAALNGVTHEDEQGQVSLHESDAGNIKI